MRRTTKENLENIQLSFRGSWRQENYINSNHNSRKKIKTRWTIKVFGLTSGFGGFESVINSIKSKTMQIKTSSTG